MTRARRAVLLGGLAITLGALAASDVAGREAALRKRLGPLVDVVVARTPLHAGRRITADRLAIRRVPARFAPQSTFASPAEVVGLRPAAPVPAGADIGPAAIADTSRRPGTPVRPGERIVEVVGIGSPQLILPGTHVDVVVTRDSNSGGDDGRTTLALQDVPVVASAPAPEATGSQAGRVGPRVTASLQVSLREAVYLTAAQSFASEVRLLPRAPGDRHVSSRGLSFDAGGKP
jgi:pilus assembly protein CpaB